MRGARPWTATRAWPGGRALPEPAASVLARLVGLAALVAHAASCSLVLSDEGIVGGARDAGGGVARDAGDAASEAAARPGEAGAPPCPEGDPSVVLCDAFERRELASAWGTPFARNAQVVVTDAPHASPPFALLASAGAARPGEATFAYVQRSLGARSGRPFRATLDVALAAVTAPPRGGQVVVAAVGTRRGEDLAHVQVVLGDEAGAPALHVAEETLVQGGETFTMHPTKVPVTIGRWARLRLEVTVATPGGTARNEVTLAVDGAAVLRDPLQNPVVPGAPELNVGAVWVSSDGAPFAVAHDDVVLRVADATP